MNYLTYLPVFDKLTKSQQDALTRSSFVRKFGKGELLHNGSQNCTGLLLVLSGQIRAFTISDDGREITMYRLFERDICIFSASCIMNISGHLFLSIEKAEHYSPGSFFFLPFKSTFMPKYSLEKNNTNSNLSSGFVLFPNGGALVT